MASGIKMEKIDLFSCPVYKTKINGSLYNKQELYESLEKNFLISPKRFSPDTQYPISSFHTYHNDWENPKFQKVSFLELLPIYDEIIINFMNEVFANKKCEYEWHITNVNVGKDGSMESHNHLIDKQYTTGYVMIHYMSFDKEKHSPTTFTNYSYLKHNPNIMEIGSYVDDTDPKNSFYFSNYSLTTEEDDVIIFPHYLEHSVKPTNRDDIDKLRIIVAINISVKIQGE
jgi:hypothetical protein